jgi:uncharacterized peroxidase-related enzyme
MALVTPLQDQEFDAELLEEVQFFKGPLGVIPNSVRTMARRPEIARAFTALNVAVMECHGAVTAEQKRLIGYMTSLATGCRYCQAHTALGAKRFGSTEERLADLWTYRESPHYSAAERAAFDFAIAAASVPNGVNDELEAALREHWSDDDIVEILGVVALFGYLNRWNDSMGTTLEELPVQVAEEHLADNGWELGKHT